ncbi:MAG: purine-nucleoside phosphorylase [Elusimicrobiota bacterium]
MDKKPIGIVLGSGLGSVAESWRIEDSKPLEKVLNLKTGNKRPPLGHHRRLLRASFRGREIVALQGRLHYYEGFDMETVTSPMRYFKSIGVDTVILSFAAGAINRKFRPRDLVLVTDHIHRQSANPLRGSTDFIDCTKVYDPGLAQRLSGIASKIKLRLIPGVYASMDGPTYETPAEIRGLARLGADLVGMSLTAEALMAHSLGIKVVGLGWVSNMASGLVKKHTLTHHEVLDLSREVVGPFSKLLSLFFETF